MPSILSLNLKKEYFEAIKASEKLEEYREYKEYWRKRLEGREYTEIHIKLGYPPKGDTSRVMRFKWNGYQVKGILHKEFGRDPVKVFAIDLSKRLMEE